jgi:hypothetical protein
VNEDKEDVLRADDVVQEEFDPNLQITPDQVDGGGCQGFVETYFVNVLEELWDPFRPLAAVAPVGENGVTRQGVYQEGSRSA